MYNSLNDLKDEKCNTYFLLLTITGCNSQEKEKEKTKEEEKQ
ncbi:hypothetical protein [Aquimarina celericrescens]|uniref:Lipoprotein n=1 Tax=Aquimarina celericrescens TaxID=1964542 RepID=A0ABW5AS06_9FLAO